MKYVVRVNVVSSPVVLDVSNFSASGDPLALLEASGAGNSVLGVSEEAWESLLTTDFSSLQESLQDEDPIDGVFLLEQEETEFKYYRHAQSENGSWLFLYSTIANFYVRAEAPSGVDLVEKISDLTLRFVNIFDESDTESGLGIYRLSGTVFDEAQEDPTRVEDEAFEGIWWRNDEDFKAISDPNAWPDKNYLLAAE